jgi:hypothetical protein
MMHCVHNNHGRSGISFEATNLNMVVTLRPLFGSTDVILGKLYRPLLLT